jgi:molecular chaperone HtpG
MSETFAFKAEIKQLLDILVHSLYTEREIFLRELISNASDALNRLQFEQLTNHNVLDPEAELKITLKADEDAGTLTISDTGIGMTAAEMEQNLGVIAHSGAKAFIEAMKEAKNGATAQDVIGQFGVGFYSVFMVADKVRVVSRSYQPDERACAWESDGGETYTLSDAERENRGTDIIIYLKEDAKEFLQEWTLKDIIRRHSDYIAFPIYVGDDEEATNKRTAIWRQNPKEVTEEQYADFYKMMTFDFEGAKHHMHIRADVPLQFYALLYIPSSAEHNMFSPRKEPGLKLYARKVLIQEYCTDLLPEYLQFMQGVVDSEDLPLSVSRESVQATRVMANLKKALTSRVLSELKRIAKNDLDKYLDIYKKFGRMLKQGVVVSAEDKSDLEKLLYFNTTHDDDPNQWHTLQAYVDRMVENQSDIYYVIGDDFHSARRSPHLEPFRRRGIEVLYFTDPLDSFMIMGLTEYDGHKLRNVDEADIDLTDIGTLAEEDAETPREAVSEGDFGTLIGRFKAVLGDRVQDVRESKSLVGSAARLVSGDNSNRRNMFRINRLLDKEYELPVKTLELNPRHPLLHNLSGMLAANGDNRMIDVVIEQLFETALLQDGIHPDPAAMSDRLLVLMEAATGTPADRLNLASVAPQVANGAQDAAEPEAAVAEAEVNVEAAAEEPVSEENAES